MRITVHRGINQIGGCITEIATTSSKILIDLGGNLPDGDGRCEDRLADRNAVRVLTEGCDAVIYSHYHGDHTDLCRYVPATVPQYIGRIAKKVMLCKARTLAAIPGGPVSPADVAVLESMRLYRPAYAIGNTGDIRVTPFFVSHSACDAYMFLIEADGKRILHTGDFRTHGYLGKGLFPVLREYVLRRPIDVLITEGTMLSRPNEAVRHENDLKVEAAGLMKRCKYTFVLCSSTDIDRLATFHMASKEAGRSFLCDRYQSEMLGIFSSAAVGEDSPYKFDNVRFYCHGHRNQLELLKKRGFCMLVRGSRRFSFVHELLDMLGRENCQLIYSMWSGYLKPGRNRKKEYIELWESFGRRTLLHTSGHASANVLAEVCRTVDPVTVVIPIHSELSDDFRLLDIPETLRSKIVTESAVMGGIEIIMAPPQESI